MPTRQVHILGVRHHSPACARLVEAQINALKPRFVLIEGPSDYNTRIPELLLGHELPIALYSFTPRHLGMAQCWYPLLDYSPEWVALNLASATHATVRFIDLPHWHYRTLAESARTVGERDGRARYSKVLRELCQRFHCDSDDALWDHLFEAAPPEELAARLDEYFALLRGSPVENRTDQDDAREQFMARYITWAAGQCLADEVVLVVCGGWHKSALEQLWPLQAVADEPTVDELRVQSIACAINAQDQTASGVVPCLDDAGSERRAGSYLVPYQFRQVEALAGYASGMQSPMFYQWVWQHGYQDAIEHAKRSIVAALRHKKVPISTAELIALDQCQQQLAGLRGHLQPMRIDLLDAVQSTLIKDALDVEPPWSVRGLLNLAQHPVLTEALIAMTGDGFGKLHSDTPQPPLLASVQQELMALDLWPTDTVRELVLDRRDALAQRRAVQLWRLSLLGCTSVRLQGITAPNAARALPKSLHFQERWQLQRNLHWHAELIEAAAFGADLESASLAKLRAKIDRENPSWELASLSSTILDALRAGFTNMSASLADEIAAKLPNTHDHVALAYATKNMQQIQALGFFGNAADALIADLLVPMLAQLLWLVDGLQVGSTQTMDGDVQAIRCLYTQARRLGSPENACLDGSPALQLAESIARIAWRTGAPASLRGAALGAAYQLGSLTSLVVMPIDAKASSADEVVIQMTKAQAPREQLGDFLFGLFALARGALNEQANLVSAIHQALDNMSNEDFLIALPQLRGAFAWFPPRERAKLAEHAAILLGIEGSQKRSLMQLPSGTEALLHARAIESAVDRWAEAHGVEL